LLNNKNFLIFILLIFISCGPSEEEIQAQINDAVESALQTSSTTTTTLAPSTSTSTTTTTLAPTTTTTTTSTTTTTLAPTTTTTTTSTTTTTLAPTTTTTTTSTTTTTTLPATTTTTVDSEKQICLYFLESFKIVSDGVKDTGQLESDILNSLSKNNISWASAYELQLEVVDFYSGWLDTWKNAYPNNNNIEFWNNYIEIYRLRALSAISLAEYYYYYDDAYFKESNDYLDQAVSISARTTFNSC